jgi:hypothetical protein
MAVQGKFLKCAFSHVMIFSNLSNMLGSKKLRSAFPSHRPNLVSAGPIHGHAEWWRENVQGLADQLRH